MKRGIFLWVGVAMAVAVGCGSTGGSGAPFGEDGDGGGACPATMPSGGACASEGQQCNYGCDTGGPGTATCKSGLWSVSRSNIACNAPPVDAGPPPADAPFACGTQTCGVNQYCVEPCCGGAAPLCDSTTYDGGSCPPGWHPAQCQQGPGCQMDPCTPPPPFCVDSPTDSRAQGCQSYGKGRTLTCLCA